MLHSGGGRYCPLVARDPEKDGGGESARFKYNFTNTRALCGRKCVWVLGRNVSALFFLTEAGLKEQDTCAGVCRAEGM